jgi:cysteine desulfurase
VTLNQLFQRFRRRLRGRLFLDAASGLPESATSRHARRAAERLWGNPSSPHAEGREAKLSLEASRRSVARTLGAREGEVIFCSGGTEAVNLAVLGVARAMIAEGRPVTIIVAASAHPSARRAAEAARDEGAALLEVPVDPRGRITPEAVASSVGEGLSLIFVPRVAGETGAISDTRAIGESARRAAAAVGGRAALVVDAAQAAVFENVSPSRLGADFLALDGAKFGGPKGSGCLVARGEVLPISYGGRQEGGRRAGTENVPAAAGFAAALIEAGRASEAFSNRASSSAEAAWAAICRAVPDAARNVAAKDSAPHFLSVCLPGRDGAYACAVLDELGVSVSPSAACRAAAGERLSAGYPNPACAPSSVRLSFSGETGASRVSWLAEAFSRAAALAVLPSPGPVVE